MEQVVTYPFHSHTHTSHHDPAAAAQPGSTQTTGASGDVGGSGTSYQLPQRFRAKREKSHQQFHCHKETASMREDLTLANHLIAARHTLPIPFPLSPGPGPMGLGRAGVLMFPAPNGQMMAKIPYKEPLLPSGPPPLFQHHRGLNFAPLAFANHANMKAAMHAMGMFSPAKKDMGFKIPPAPPESPKPHSYTASDVNKVHHTHTRSESTSSVGRLYSRSASTGSVGNLSAVHDASLKKLMKDLYRCEVSIARYQTMLNEHCDAGLRSLHQAFITLHIGLNAREKDIARELQMTRQTAGTILQHRHSTACVLRQLAERAGELEETQLHELKKQIKQFVVDRKVDEEIGTTSRFIADPDDLLPHVMTFGKVVNRRHVYTSWEGDPAAAVEKSKHASRSSASVFSSPTSSLSTTPTTPSPTTKDEHTAKSSSQESFDQKLDDSVFISTTPERDEIGGGEDVSSGCGNRSPTSQPVDQLSTLEPERGAEDAAASGDRVSSGSSSASTHTIDGACKSEAQGGYNSEQECEKTADMDQLRPHHSLLTCSSHTSSSSTATFDSKHSPHPTAAVAPSPDTTTPKPASSGTPSHKGRSPFSRKFATPIVVTHTRRSFTKPLPKHLDPKSTVTLLLSSSVSPSMQQKHSKHKNQKFKRQFSPARHLSEGALDEGSSTITSLPSPLSLRLKGREKERELWRKRYNSASSSGASFSGELSRSLESGREGGKAKRSPEELAAIQSRVRESLRAQGVFLYDPITGTVPISRREEESVDSGVGYSEPHQGKVALDLKKKTPTQLRRERKKRQKERERRQKELERRTQEEGVCDKRGGGRIALLEKTSANPSASTSRTTSPFSSISNNISDTQLETVSLSLSQSPPPLQTNTPASSGESGDKSTGREGERENGRGVRSDVSASINSDLTATSGSEQLNTTDRCSDGVDTLTSLSTVVPAKSVPSTQSGERAGSDSASIEWDMSQKGQERVLVQEDSSPRPRPVSTTQGGASLQEGKFYSVMNGEASLSHSSDESAVITGASNTLNSSLSSSSLSSCSSLCLVTNATAQSSPNSPEHQRPSHRISPLTSPPHLPSGSAKTHTPLPSGVPFSAIPSSLHNSNRPFSTSSSNPAPTTSDALISDPTLAGKQLKDIMCIDTRLHQNGVINGHEE